jgi:hypothetical protein
MTLPAAGQPKLKCRLSGPGCSFASANAAEHDMRSVAMLPISAINAHLRGDIIATVFRF